MSKLVAVFVYGPRLELIICPRLLFKTVKNIFGGTVALGCMSDMYYVLPCVFYCKINAVFSDYCVLLDQYLWMLQFEDNERHM